MPNPDIGHVDCEMCGLPAPVRLDKHGKAYYICNDAECGYQGMTRRPKASDRLKAKMRPVITPEAPPAPPKPAPKKPAPKKAPPPPPAHEKKKGFLDDFFSN